MPVTDFTLSPEDFVYIAAAVGKESFVFRFDLEGRYRSTTKLQISGPFEPVGLAVFANGNFLLLGETRGFPNGSSVARLIAIFDESGHLVTKLDASKIGKDRPDESSIPPLELEAGNVSVSADDNAYIMLRSDRPSIIVISSFGAGA